MPWKTKSPMDLRREFIKRLATGERLTDFRREYGISRKTGSKFRRRFEELGVAGLSDQSRAPKVIPHRTPPEVEALILAERKGHPTWGPRKLRSASSVDWMGGLSPRPLRLAASWLEMAGSATTETAAVRTHAHHTPPSHGAGNDVWRIDYKGQFRLGDGTHCYPLTVTDQFSRYILGCEGMAAIRRTGSRGLSGNLPPIWTTERLTRSDNGVPFSSTGLRGLTKLSVMWLRLGIVLERIRPAHPEENGQHERMHRTLKFETTRPSRTNLLQQQERFDDFVDEFNTARPHEALDMKRPIEVYTPSTRPFPHQLPEPSITRSTTSFASTGRPVYIPGIGQFDALSGSE